MNETLHRFLRLSMFVKACVRDYKDVYFTHKSLKFAQNIPIAAAKNYIISQVERNVTDKSIKNRASVF